jgi:hypothetical protein
MGISKWESFLEKHIEGFFNKKFGSALEPFEVEKQLIREMQRKRKKSGKNNLLPNSYSLYISITDYQCLCSKRFIDELYMTIEKETIRSDCFIEGKLQVHIEKNEDFSQGMCEVSSCFQEAPVGKNYNEPNTLILDRSAFEPPLNLPVVYKITSLTVVEGPDLDAYLEFGEKQIYIGRREKNDFILTDTNASRMHAYITFECHRHILYDAESLNGTCLNGQKISSACLCSGDEIKIGNTVLLYEVI